MILSIPVIVKYNKNNLNTTKPPYSIQIIPVAWAFLHPGSTVMRTRVFSTLLVPMRKISTPLIRLWHFIHSFICSFIHSSTPLLTQNKHLLSGKLLETRFKPIMSYGYQWTSLVHPSYLLITSLIFGWGTGYVVACFSNQCKILENCLLTHPFPSPNPI